jgi:phage major head subunit gpT-like protein
MPVTQSDIANLLLPGIRTIIGEAMVTAQDSGYQDICTIIPSTKLTEPYAWLGALPGVEQFLGERKVHALVESNYSLTNLVWVDTLGVDKDALADDQYGAIRVRANALGEAIGIHKTRYAYETLAAGNATGSLCFDGQKFFDSDHVTPGADYQVGQQNYGNAALSAASLKAGILAMRKFKDDRGAPMGISPDTLVVPPDLEFDAVQLLSSPLQPGSANNDVNVLQGKLKVVTSSWLTDTNNWFLLATKRAIKPLILQERSAVEVSMLAEGTEAAFMRRQYLFGVESRYVVGYGPWQLAYAGIVT